MKPKAAAFMFLCKTTVADKVCSLKILKLHVMVPI